MCRAMRKIGLAAPVLELVSEPVSREWLAKLSEQERHIVANLQPLGAILILRGGWRRASDFSYPDTLKAHMLSVDVIFIAGDNRHVQERNGCCCWRRLGAG